MGRQRRRAPKAPEGMGAEGARRDPMDPIPNPGVKPKQGEIYENIRRAPGKGANGANHPTGAEGAAHPGKGAKGANYPTGAEGAPNPGKPGNHPTSPNQTGAEGAV
uniref:Uncharacterized protein n=1 Tax=Placozoa sp. H2 TaxID=573895 RepID=A0A7I6N5M6_9METZ|nr:hypothetical protein [Placozoa sp. H2 HM-2017]